MKNKSLLISQLASAAPAEIPELEKSSEHSYPDEMSDFTDPDSDAVDEKVCVYTPKTEKKAVPLPLPWLPSDTSEVKQSPIKQSKATKNQNTLTFGKTKNPKNGAESARQRNSVHQSSKHTLSSHRKCI